ncbi:MAG: hypothetical protein ACRC67_21655 [Inquilinus sp.]|uniref:hypothetical protein n=1 Tax=Inquilinus sp. TaxID=1932117 RepID=UPI003F390D9A
MNRCTPLQAREYKLLLKPDRFAGAMSLERADQFWNTQIRSVVQTNLDNKKDGKSRHGRGFDPAKHRTITFRDTGNHRLYGADYILRERVDLDRDGDDASKPELTLKLRTTDLFVAADTPLPGFQDGADTEFEEDIAPLQVSVTRPGHRCVSVAEPRSIRSRFAVSTTQPVPDGLAIDRLGAAFELYPRLLSNLMLTARDEIRSDEALRSGPVISELVFKNAEVDLGGDVAARFTLTLWYFDADTATPRVAEISFKCKVENGYLPRGAASRALALFVGMQGLGDWVNFEEQSKTALALPPKA